jgi:hypothetical protein
VRPSAARTPAMAGAAYGASRAKAPQQIMPLDDDELKQF